MRIKKVNELNIEEGSFLGSKMNSEDAFNLLHLLSNMNEQCKKFLDSTKNSESITCFLRNGIANFTNEDKMTLTVKIDAKFKGDKVSSIKSPKFGVKDGVSGYKEPEPSIKKPISPKFNDKSHRPGDPTHPYKESRPKEIGEI